MRIVIHQFPSAGPEADPLAGGPQIDMTPDGRFVEPPRPSFGTQLARWAGIAVAVAVALGIVALAFWMALFLLPIAIAAALIGYAAFRWRMSKFGPRL